LDRCFFEAEEALAIPMRWGLLVAALDLD